MRTLKLIIVGITTILLFGCQNRSRESYTYQDPAEVTYEVEGTDEITNHQAIDEAVELVEQNLSYVEEKQMEGYLSTIVSSAREETEAELAPFFESYNIEHTILGIEVLEQQPNQILLQVEQQSILIDKDPNAEEYRDHIAEANHTLTYENDKWKIAETTITDNFFLE